MSATKTLLSLEEYLTYDNGTENRYKLVDGQLVTMPPESDRKTLGGSIHLRC